MRRWLVAVVVLWLAVLAHGCDNSCRSDLTCDPPSESVCDDAGADVFGCGE